MTNMSIEELKLKKLLNLILGFGFNNKKSLLNLNNNCVKSS